MSEESQVEGRNFYICASPATREWFERQWQIWPERANQQYTTNISFLYGGVIAHREEHGGSPGMSKDFSEHVDWLDRHASTFSPPLQR